MAPKTKLRPKRKARAKDSSAPAELPGGEPSALSGINSLIAFKEIQARDLFSKDLRKSKEI